MPEYGDILREVLERVRPTPEEEEHIRNVARKVVFSIKRRKGSFVDVIVAGSAARGTNLRGSSDIDIFLLYPRNVPKEKMEEEVLCIGKSLSDHHEVRYAEHPYVRVFVDGVEVDVVPAYKISPGQRIISATDRTPLHQKYLEEKLDDRLRDEVRLLKAFMKGIGVYGAEIKTQGFSGYLCELLVLHYGSFLNLLRAASSWKPQIIIDIEGHAKAKFPEPLVVVDPVDPYRNVAAPVSLDSLAVFVAAAREFLEHPSLLFFFPEDVPLPAEHMKRIMLQRKTVYVFLLTSYPRDVSPDIIWGEIRRISKIIARKLGEQGYSVMNHAAWTDEVRSIVLLFEISGGHTAFVEKRIGPPVFDKENSERFLEKHRGDFFGPYIEDGRWCVDLPRTVNSPEIALYTIVEGLRRSGSIRKHLEAALSSGYEVIRGRAIIPFYVSNRAFARWFSQFLVRRPPWLKR